MILPRICPILHIRSKRAYYRNIFLSLQTLSEMPGERKNMKNEQAWNRLKKQLNRLIYLEESLLVLSRLDAGTLMFKKIDCGCF